MSNIWQETVTRNRSDELEKINRLALERIEFFSGALEREYGLHFKTGVELEYYHLDYYGKKVQKPDPGQTERLNARYSKYEHMPAVKGTFIESIHTEGNKPAQEIVLGWKSLRTDVSEEDGVLEERHRRHPVSMATRLDGVRKILYRNSKNSRNTENIVFSVPNDDWSAAQQVSISVLDRQGRNLFVDDTAHHKHSALADSAASGLLDVQRQTVLLAANYPDSVDELSDKSRRCFMICSENNEKLRGKSSVSIRESYTGDKRKNPTYTNDFRIENLLPRSDSNPYLAMLQTVAGVYYGIKHHHEAGQPLDTNQNAGNSTHALPRFEFAHQQFQGSSLARKACGEELHDVISRFYSPQAITERKRQEGKQR